MAKREDPFLLTNYRFLPNNLRTRINEFIEKLDETCKEFAIKRYVQGKTLSNIAEEMGYVERSLYSLRDRILNLWDLTFINDDFEYHCDRVLSVIKRYGVVEHYRLANNLNLDRAGLNHIDLKNILDILLVNGQIKLFIKPRPNGGRPKRKYVITNSVIIQSFLSQDISG